jgi:hypothetical protein
MAVAFSRFLELNATARLRLLTDLAFDATIDGRGTYVPMSDEVENGPALRRVNEFVHRIVSLMQHILAGAPNTDAYAESIWVQLILPWAQTRPGKLEAIVEKAEASDL